MGVRIAMLDRRVQQAERAEHTRRGRHDDLLHAERPCKLTGVHGSVAAEGHQYRIARIAAAFGGDRANGARHSRVGDEVHTVRGFLDRHAQDVRKIPLDHRPCPLDVDLEVATDQRVAG